MKEALKQLSNRSKEFWNELPPDRSKPRIFIPKETARYIGNKFIPTSTLLLIIAIGTFIAGYISLYGGTLRLDQIFIVLISVFSAVFSSLIAISYTVRLGIDGRVQHLFVSLLGVLGVITGYAVVYKTTGLMFSGKFTEICFGDAWYFSAVTWTTLGYGDFSPPYFVRILAVSEALIGYVFTATIIGVFVSKLGSTLSGISKEMREKQSENDFNRLRAELDRLEKQNAEYPNFDDD